MFYNPNPTGDRTLAVTLAPGAGTVAGGRAQVQAGGSPCTPLTDSRVVSTSVVLVMPGNAATPAIPRVNPVVTIAFPRTNDQQLAEELVYSEDSQGSEISCAAQFPRNRVAQ